MTTRDERASRLDFAARYAITSGDAHAAIERDVVGAVWGVNGYTTRAQADELGRRLDLRPGTRLLDVGTGRGWPGVYLSSQTGCSVVGTDVPIDALTAARCRAHAEGIDERVALVAATGADQPFRRAAFDAVVLSDVLC